MTPQVFHLLHQLLSWAVAPRPSFDVLMAAGVLRALSTTVNMRRGRWEALSIEFKEVNIDDVSLGSVGKSQVWGC
jgi:hypothetical protein